MKIFEGISWTEFIIFIGIAVGLYYTAILIFFPGDSGSKLKEKFGFSSSKKEDLSEESNG